MIATDAPVRLVAKWLGHSSYLLALTTYADYIPDVETENPLPEPCCRRANYERRQLVWVGVGLREWPRDEMQLLN